MHFIGKSMRHREKRFAQQNLTSVPFFREAGLSELESENPMSGIVACASE